MEATKIIERAEKFRLLGRFDRRSAISFLNDGLYEITSRQGLTINETFYGFTGKPFFPKNVVVRIDSIEVEKPHEYQYRVSNDGSISMYMLDNGQYRKIEIDDEVEIDEIKISYVGYKKIEEIGDDVEVPDYYETALVYFLRSKMLEEYGEVESSQYFLQQYMREMVTKTEPRHLVVAEPSKYSLM